MSENRVHMFIQTGKMMRAGTRTVEYKVVFRERGEGVMRKVGGWFWNWGEAEGERYLQGGMKGVTGWRYGNWRASGTGGEA